MSGLAMVTQVTVNVWAHVTRPHEWRISVDGEENLCEEKTFPSGSVIACVDSFSITNNKRKSYGK